MQVQAMLWGQRVKGLVVHNLSITAPLTLPLSENVC